jgi:hypothetical protein
LQRHTNCLILKKLLQRILMKTYKILLFFNLNIFYCSNKTNGSDISFTTYICSIVFSKIKCGCEVYIYIYIYKWGGWANIYIFVCWATLFKPLYLDNRIFFSGCRRWIILFFRQTINITLILIIKSCNKKVLPKSFRPNLIYSFKNRK